jgi:hypothetical protein
MMKHMIAKQCVYCTHSPGITKDHVPPRSFFLSRDPEILLQFLPVASVIQMRRWTTIICLQS